MSYAFKFKPGDNVTWEETAYVVYQTVIALYVPGNQTFPWYGLGNNGQMAVYVYAPYIDFGEMDGGGGDPPPDGPCPNGTQPPC